MWWLIHTAEKAESSMLIEPPASPTIFRVPSNLRSYNQHDYEPELISIGPYHYGKSLDPGMEALKWRMLHHYLSMVPHGIDNDGFSKMNDLEEQARDCYSEMINMASHKFREMLLLDGCFLVLIFIVQHDDDDKRILQVREHESLLFYNMWFRSLISRDLLLLENQIPFFIVKHLLDTLRMPGWDSFRLQKAAITSFIHFLPDYPNIPLRQLEQELQVDHFLHLLHEWLRGIPKLENLGNRRRCWQLPSKLFCSALSLTIYKTRHCLSKVLPCCNNPLLSEKSPTTVPTMTELVKAGVKIKVRKANIFLDISFCKDKGELGIPAIGVDDNINFFFVNLIAFEQCCRRHGLDVTHYTMLLNELVNTSGGVQLLYQERIICRNLGEVENIALLFNKLRKGVRHISRQNYLQNVYEDLNTYCQSRRNRWHANLLRWRENLVHNYFSSPWSFISLVAAVLLIVLTILQTVYTVLGYYKT